jgi:hypothetical protein
LQRDPLRRWQQPWLATRHFAAASQHPHVTAATQRLAH